MRYWTATVFIAAMFGAFVVLRRRVAAIACVIVATISGGLWLFATLSRLSNPVRGSAAVGAALAFGAVCYLSFVWPERRRETIATAEAKVRAEERHRLAEAMTANLHALHGSRPPMPRPREGWLATGTAESGDSPTRWNSLLVCG